MSCRIIKKWHCKNLECDNIFDQEESLGECPLCDSKDIENIAVRVIDLSEESFWIKQKFIWSKLLPDMWLLGNSFGTLILLEKVTMKEYDSYEISQKKRNKIRRKKMELMTIDKLIRDIRSAGNLIPSLAMQAEDFCTKLKLRKMDIESE